MHQARQPDADNLFRRDLTPGERLPHHLDGALPPRFRVYLSPQGAGIIYRHLTGRGGHLGPIQVEDRAPAGCGAQIDAQNVGR